MLLLAQTAAFKREKVKLSVYWGVFVGPLTCGRVLGYNRTPRSQIRVFPGVSLRDPVRSSVIQEKLKVASLCGNES